MSVSSCKVLTTVAALSVLASAVSDPVAAVDIMPVQVNLNKVTAAGIGEKIGIVSLTETAKGLEFDVVINGIAPGDHGFHVHEKGDCGPGEKDGKMAAGVAAGPHYDPEGHKSHQGPENAGHRGDLPVLKISTGETKEKLIAPRLKLDDVRGRAIMVHEGGDTYSDQPELGGGGARIACGVVPE